jgi:hypothetical protein
VAALASDARGEFALAFTHLFCFQARQSHHGFLRKSGLLTCSKSTLSALAASVSNTKLTRTAFYLL